MTSIPIADLNQDEAPLTFPFYADGAGWQSEIQLVNTTGSTLYGTVQLFPSLRGSGADFVYTIPPHAGCITPDSRTRIGNRNRLGASCS